MKVPLALSAEAPVPTTETVPAAASPFALPDPPWKRPLDVVLGAILLVASLPFWLVTAGAVKLTSRGPVFHVQEAIGRGGTPFRFYKFRTMRAGADNARHRQYIAAFVRGEVEWPAGQPGAPFKMRNDERVTAVGRLLRRTSLDELPQLLNVLRGEMSLVGPRPPLPYEYDLYDDDARRRLAVRPGITGLSQVRARSRATFRQMVELDLEYIRRRSLRLDLAILLRTVPAALSAKGAC